MGSLRKEIIRFSYNELCPTNEIGGSGCRNGSCRLRHALVIAIIFQQQSDSEHGVNYLFIYLFPRMFGLYGGLNPTKSESGPELPYLR